MATNQKILVVRVGRAGDVVMITPALRALLDALPDAEFHLLTRAEGARVLRGFDARLTRTWLYSRRFPRSWLVKGALLRAFRREDYAGIYIFESRPLYARWLAGVGSPLHVLPERGEGAHYCEQCLQVVDAALGSPVPRTWVNLPVSAAGRADARALLAENGVDPDGLVVGLHPTFSGSGLPFFRDRKGLTHRNWPAANFSRVAQLLRDESRRQGRELAVVIDCLPGDAAIIAPIVDAADGAVTLLCAPPDFQRYKGLLAGLDVLVTPNTGPMHIAAAVATPLVPLFSHWSVDDCGPFMDPTRYEVLRAEDTAEPQRGLAAITPEQVVAAVWRVIARAPRAGVRDPA